MYRHPGPRKQDDNVIEPQRPPLITTPGVRSRVEQVAPRSFLQEAKARRLVYFFLTSRQRLETVVMRQIQGRTAGKR